MAEKYQNYTEFKQDIWSSERQLGRDDPRMKGFRQFERVNPAPVTVVDLGCGDGSFLRALSRPQVRRRIGVDFSWKNQNAPGVEFYNGDVFDVIDGLEVEGDVLFTCFDFLEHLQYDDIARLLRAIINRFSCGRNVYVLIRSPNTVSPFSLFGQEGDLTHESRLCVMRLEQLITTASIKHSRLFCSGSRYFDWRNLKRLPFALFSSLGIFLFRMTMLGLGCRDAASYYPAFMLCLQLHQQPAVVSRKRMALAETEL